MLDSIYIGLTGLLGYSRGLKVISNNVANLNTPGFKSSQLQFANLFYANGDSKDTFSKGSIGLGLNTLSTSLNFRQGEFKQTGGSLDLAIDGEGMFVVRDDAGVLRYTRAGQFEFNSDGILVNRSDGSHVMAMDSTGQLTEIRLDGLRNNAAKATSNVTFRGNLSNDGTTHVLGSVQVIDALGGQHNLSVTFTNGSPANPGQWAVKVADGTTTVATGNINFVNGLPDPATSTLSFTYSPAGVAAVPLNFDFSTDVTSFAAGTTSTLALNKQDGFTSGALTSAGFDAQGRLKLEYANGQSTTGMQLAIARVDNLDALEPLGGNLFGSRNKSATRMGFAGADSFGKVSSGIVELSNVDLSQEFSDLIITQRGYQAASQIVSTANEMIQVVFDMKARR